jgi:anti-sigma-K factor RskA
MAENDTRGARAAATRANNLAALIARVEEKLNAMDNIGHERAATVTLLVQKLENQQGQLNQLTTDMAVLKNQHANFWKFAAMLFAVLSLIGGALGWAVATLLPLIHKV